MPRGRCTRNDAGFLSVLSDGDRARTAAVSTPSRIKKAVVPAAGLGTRHFPASHAVMKELFPVVGPDSTILNVHWGTTIVPLHLRVKEPRP